MINIVSPEEATELLANGAVGILPTDTVYGLVTSAHNEKSVERFYALKSRDQKPGTLIAASIDQLLAIGALQSEIDKISHYWPNPISAVLTVSGHNYLHQSVGTLAMRVVSDPVIRDMLLKTGPLITSSANQPGQPPATTISEAIAYFGDNVDFYVDGGIIKDVLPSAIIRPTENGVEILRQGSITL
ncbi:MAG: hypothetical protein JWN75_885 [Candidatus Saccharibacteria bacterium]|nr:hypothetical protein [Candidatus Saccharibacteria bacterium]